MGMRPSPMMFMGGVGAIFAAREEQQTQSAALVLADGSWSNLYSDVQLGLHLETESFESYLPERIYRWY